MCLLDVNLSPLRGFKYIEIYQEKSLSLQEKFNTCKNDPAKEHIQNIYAGGISPFQSLRLSISFNVMLPYPKAPVGLLMDQSLQQGPAMQTQSIEEELSSPMAICVMIKRVCCYINLGPGRLPQNMCMCAHVCRSVCAGQVTSVFLVLCFLC